MTYLNNLDQVERRTQLSGTISKIEENGIFVNLDDGKVFSLPPDLSAIEVAPPGDYKFKTTGKVVVNPDFMTSWTIHKSESSN